jgi:MFS family permease
MFVFGAGVGTLDVGMNASGVVVEERYGRSIFSSLHAMWSAGGILGALIGGFALAGHSPMWLTLSVTGGITAIASLLLTSSLIADKPKAQPKGELKTEGKRANRKVLGLVLAVGVMACFAAIAEGSAVDWSALHLNTVLNATSAEAALGVGAFSTAMAIARLLGDKLVDRFGRINVIRYGSLIATVGVATASFAPSWQVAVVGWGVLGIGVSGVIPQLFIAAGSIGEESHKGRNMAKVFGLTYFGIMAGPALIGFLTNWIPLNQALALGAILCLCVAAGASILKSKKFR